MGGFSTTSTAATKSRLPRLHYLVSRDGDIFTFGDAQFYGSNGDKSTYGPNVSLVTADGKGYRSSIGAATCIRSGPATPPSEASPRAPTSLRSRSPRHRAAADAGSSPSLAESSGSDPPQSSAAAAAPALGPSASRPHVGQRLLDPSLTRRGPRSRRRHSLTLRTTRPELPTSVGEHADALTPRAPRAPRRLQCRRLRVPGHLPVGRTVVIKLGERFLPVGLLVIGVIHEHRDACREVRHSHSARSDDDPKRVDANVLGTNIHPHRMPDLLRPLRELAGRAGDALAATDRFVACGTLPQSGTPADGSRSGQAVALGTSNATKVAADRCPYLSL